LAVICLAPSHASAQRRGIVGRQAPPWQVDTWFQLPADSSTLNVQDYRGKVLYLYGFQSWCPGCHSRGFPTLVELIQRFKDDDRVAFVAIQTTFEGFATNTPSKALATAKQYNLSIPVGHSGIDGRRSGFLRDYRTGGTPWTIIIDSEGVVRFNDFHIDPDKAQHLIEQLLAEAPPTPTEASATGSTPPPATPLVVTLPPARGGQDRLGTPFPKADFDRWIQPIKTADATQPLETDPPTAGQGVTDRQKKPTLTLYRWWTDGCSFCHASLPAMEKMRTKYADAGLRVIGVYHPKPPRPVDDATIARTAADLGFHGDIAVDQNWSMLQQAYMQGKRRGATSISLLVDDRGVIRFVHPGPILFPSAKPEHAQPNSDYTLLDKAIGVLLKQHGSAQTPS
jgi:thiol-disulfide isomerase/thioredoxin